MFKCNSLKDINHEFIPFTLNMKLTTKESARNLYTLLHPIIYSRLYGVPIDVKLTNINSEQRQIAKDICNILSNNVFNINEK